MKLLDANDFPCAPSSFIISAPLRFAGGIILHNDLKEGRFIPAGQRFLDPGADTSFERWSSVTQLADTVAQRPSIRIALRSQTT